MYMYMYTIMYSVHVRNLKCCNIFQTEFYDVDKSCFTYRLVQNKLVSSSFNLFLFNCPLFSCISQEKREQKRERTKATRRASVCLNAPHTTKPNGFFQRLHDIFQAQKYSEIAAVVLCGVLFSGCTWCIVTAPRTKRSIQA